MEHRQPANRLFIRAGSTPERSLNWFTELAENDEDIHLLPDAEHLSELAAQPSAQNVSLLIPASEVIFRQVTVPQRAGKNTRQMIAWQTEESIATDVDTLHWVELYRQEQTLYAAGIEVDFLRNWIHRFRDAGLTVRHVYIDALLLPLPEEGWSAARLDHQWLLRQSEYSGCLVEQVLLDTLLAIAMPEVVHYYGHDQEIPPDWVHAEAPSDPLIVMKNNCPSAVNLLQGEFAVREEDPAWGRHLQRIAAGMVIFTLVLILGSKLFTWWQVSQQESALKNQMLTLHQSAFPQDKHTRNLKFYFEQNMKKTPTAFLPALAKLTAYQGQVPQIAIDKLDFQQKTNQFTLQITTDNRVAIDDFLKITANDFHFAVSNLTTSATGVTATLTQRSKS
ncbi:type II secretion system protein L (GspL) [Rahnella sp. BIGb0236]|uniref:type II secretion system protein GspL n=1 Tax=Rahnella sp. BIGb0236 TaxID=2485117 RepID=UPI0010601C4F|nr:type II secretion system protein GspL [Rahnella sp. BIGb0236]TDS93298.1 type II secretion system protein L (GspL) [Rahnella sp. BIGb0236]